MDIVNEIFGLLFALVIIWTLWGIAMYFFELTSEEAKRENKPIILNGATSLVGLMIVWALVAWIRSWLGL